MTQSAEKDAGLTKRPGESQTAFAIRCIQAEAWDEGFAARAEYDERRDVPTNWPDLNPYRVIPPGSRAES